MSEYRRECGREKESEREKGFYPRARYFEFAIIMALLVKLSISQVIYVDCSSHRASSFFFSPFLSLAVLLSLFICLRVLFLSPPITLLTLYIRCRSPISISSTCSSNDRSSLWLQVEKKCLGHGPYVFPFSTLVIRRSSLCEKRALLPSIINCF